jgi:hypothetical protein
MLSTNQGLEPPATTDADLCTHTMHNPARAKGAPTRAELTTSPDWPP